MGWRFRHSFKVIPGVKLNLSRRGLSASIGGAPFTLNVGPRGVYGTTSLPGTGISFREKFASVPGTPPTPPTLINPDAVPSAPSPAPFPTAPRVPTPARSSAPVQEIRSASTELLTSESLQELKRLIQTAYEEHEDISRELASARQEKTRASRRCLSWEKGFLFKRIFKDSFAKRKADAETASAKVQELEEQLRLTTIATHVDIAKEQAEPYFRMRDEFAALSECAAIWDAKSRQATNRIRERTIANERVERERVTFSLGSSDLIQWEQRVPHLQNVNGGDLFLYPGFILYRAAKHAFSVIDFHDVKLVPSLVRFLEQGPVPTDSKIVGQTWAKANKDGSRDRRFANNYQIPLALYAALTLKSDSGLWEEFQFSNPERLDRFLTAWNGFVSSFEGASMTASRQAKGGGLA
jgi:hypothetical protein